MTGFLYELLMMSVSGSIMFLFSTLVYRQTKSKYAGWYYALVITSMLLMIVPLQRMLTVPKAITVALPQSMGAAAVSRGADISYYIFGAWATGAILCLCKYLYSYFRTVDYLSAVSDLLKEERSVRICAEAKKLLGIRRRVELRKSASVRSPLLFGIFRPSIILPDRDFSDAELRMIFTHELTHLKHCDLLVKQAAAVVAAAHWFNPCVYLIRRAVNNGCELCCDETVISVMQLSDRKDYGRLLLSILEDRGRVYAYTTAMSSKQSIKQRLKRIVEFKRMPAAVRIVFVMLALSMTVCSITAFGFEFAKEAAREEIAEIFTPEAAEPPVLPTEAPAEPTAQPEVIAAPVRETQSRQPERESAEREEVYTPQRRTEADREYSYVPPQQSVTEAEYEAPQTEAAEAAVEEPKGGIGTGASRSEVNDAMGTPSRVSQDGSRETYDLPDGNTAVVQYDGDVMDKGYILVD